MREAEGQVKTHLAEVVYSSGCHREAYAFVNAAVDAIMTLHAFAYALLEGGVWVKSAESGPDLSGLARAA